MDGNNKMQNVNWGGIRLDETWNHFNVATEKGKLKTFCQALFNCTL